MPFNSKCNILIHVMSHCFKRATFGTIRSINLALPRLPLAQREATDARNQQLPKINQTLLQCSYGITYQFMPNDN